jgi:hypothetical protein
MPICLRLRMATRPPHLPDMTGSAGIDRGRRPLKVTSLRARLRIGKWSRRREVGHNAHVADSTSDPGARRGSALLSLAAAGVTGAILAWATLRNSDSTSAWLFWILSIGVPPIVLSLVAAAQYRRGHSTGAGAAAAAVYLVFLLVYNLRAADLFFIGALLQSAAWFRSRPRRPARVVDERPAFTGRH